MLVELDLTPGAAIASTIVTLIDRDGDRAISPAELEAYGRTVLAGLSVTLDGRAVAITLTRIDAPPIGDMAEGMGTIRLRATGRVDAWSGTRHLLVEKRHLPAASVYMINALLPGDPGITVVSQDRNGLQSSARIEYRGVQHGETQLTSLAIGGMSLGILLVFNGFIVSGGYARSSRRPFSVTATVAPVSATTASHNGAAPKTANTRNANFVASASVHVLPNHPQRALRMADEERDVLVVIARQHDIDRRFEPARRQLRCGTARRHPFRARPAASATSRWRRARAARRP